MRDFIAERAAQFTKAVSRAEELEAIATRPGATNNDRALADRAASDVRGHLARMQSLGDPVPSASAAPTAPAAPSAPLAAPAPTFSAASAPQARVAAPLPALTEEAEAEAVARRILASGEAQSVPHADAAVEAVAQRIIASGADDPEDEAEAVARRILASDGGDSGD